jgi:hypothetical protein
MSHHVERTRCVQRRSGVGLTLAGAAAVAVFALTTATPVANADTADVPEMPNTVGFLAGDTLGSPPLWDGETFLTGGGYTDLLGDDVLNGLNVDPLRWDVFTAFPATFSDETDGFLAQEAIDSGFGVATLANGDPVDGSTFDHISTGVLGWNNYYEETPVNAGLAISDNVNDTFVYDPSGVGFNDAGIEFGIQYLDLPNAVIPVDELNFLGAGGDILYSLPVTGDLLSLF